MMKTVKFRFDGKNYSVNLDGNFEFELTDEIVSNIIDWDTTYKTYFALNPLVMKEIKMYYGDSEPDMNRFYNEIGEQLKNDFIKFLKTI